MSQLVTKDVQVDLWEQRYITLATDALEQATFSSEGEREYAICMGILDLCQAGDKLNDAVRARVLTRIQQKRLFTFSAEGWTELSDVIKDSMDGYSSRGQRSELNTIVTVVSPFAEEHGLLVPTADRMGYLREASSALRGIIQSDQPLKARQQAVQKELDFIQHEAVSRDAVRDRYRTLRATPGLGSFNDQGDGTAIIMITGPASTLNAIRSMLGRLVEWNATATVSHSHKNVPSKLDDEAIVNTEQLSVTRSVTNIVDQATGEITATYE